MWLRDKATITGPVYLFLCFEVSELSKKFRFRGELRWLQEMKQTEKLLHGVLKRGAGQQHFVFLTKSIRH